MDIAEADSPPAAHPAAPPRWTVERVALALTVLLLGVTLLELRQVRQEQAVQACYLRVALAATAGFADAGHPEAERLARGALDSCRDPQYRRAVLDD